jgi:putative YphP/YqiW family bacilliredoxin
LNKSAQELIVMPYSEMLIKPMREDLSLNGIRETRTPDQVDAAVRNTSGTLMIIVNSVCGCAAGKARPGVVQALKESPAKPDDAITVFAGADVEATERARSYFKGYAPSSPSLGILQNGELVYMMERRDIETRSADQIASELKAAFAKFCGQQNAAAN